MPLPRHTARLGTAPVAGLLWRLGLPGVMSMFVMNLYNVVDTFWVAKLGPAAIAALTIFFPYQLLLVAIGVGSGAGFASLLSRRLGQGLIEQTNHIAAQVFFLSFGFGVFFSMVITLWPDPLLRCFGSTDDIHVLAREYLTIIGLGATFTFFSMMSNNILRGSGNTLAPMIILAIGAVLNIILDPCLIFGLFFFPAWGVKGAAVATLASQLATFGIGSIYLLTRSGYRIQRKHLCPDLAILRSVYQVGFPTFVMQCVGSFIVIFFNHLLGRYGSQAIAAYGLIFRLAGLIVMPVAGLGQGLLPVVGYNYGALQTKRLWLAVRITSLASFALLGVGCVLVQLFPVFWINLFTQDASFLPLATRALRIAAISLPLIGPPFMWITTFQALGQGRMALLVSLSRQLLFLLPLLYLLPLKMGLDGIWTAIPISDALAFLAAGLLLMREYRRQERIVPVRPVPVEITTPVTPADWTG
ncbi:MATE family efflux transporter [candidate division FCPU426 bacterium]|nr:MATE family efflux transporter [candidate division FCPU426 bacterium]